MQRREFIGSGAAIAFSLMASSPAIAKTQTAQQSLRRSGAGPVLKIKGVTIGEGRPKVIIPTTATREKEVEAFVDEIADRNDFQLLELRLDPLENGTDAQAMADLTRRISQRMPDKLLLVTFRTEAEGGRQAISDAEYSALCRAILQNGRCDLLDIEMFRDRALTGALIDLAHQHGIKIILSSHELNATPSAGEIVSRLREQQARGADILKLAAMPVGPGDVLTLLSATSEMHQRYAQRPLLTMAMGEMGVLSRMSGELSGSALTFATLGDASASGQVALEDINHVLNVVHKGMTS